LGASRPSTTRGGATPRSATSAPSSSKHNTPTSRPRHDHLSQPFWRTGSSSGGGGCKVADNKPNPRRDVFVEKWGPRIGFNAAKLRWRGAKLQIQSWMASVVGTAAGFFGAFSYGQARVVLIGICAAFYGSAIVGISVVLYINHRWRQRTSRDLGIPMHWYRNSSPPPSRDAWIRWCSARGIEPHEFTK
jgi:hypothetical protein